MPRNPRTTPATDEVHNPVTDTVVSFATKRHATNASGDAAVVSVRTLMRGDATTADRKAHVLMALTEAGLVGDYTPVPYPGSAALGGTDKYPAARLADGAPNPRYDRVFTTHRLAVLGCFADGLSYTETADHLHLNVDTVKSHAANLYRIFGVSSKVEAVMGAVRYGVLPVPR